MNDIDTTKSSVLLFGRSGCEYSQKGKDALKKLGFDTTFIASTSRGEDLADEVGDWLGDYILCFRSLYILPQHVIARARVAAINFHPGPPERRGTGCLNFALYHDDGEYGVTAHLVDSQIDNGEILCCERFPILPEDTVNSLLQRSHVALLDCFLNLMTNIKLHGPNYLGVSRLNVAHEKWCGPVHKASDLDNLAVIDPSVSRQEMERIIRATHTEAFPTRLKLHGKYFALGHDANAFRQPRS